MLAIYFSLNCEKALTKLLALESSLFSSTQMILASAMSVILRNDCLGELCNFFD